MQGEKESDRRVQANFSIPNNDDGKHSGGEPAIGPDDEASKALAASNVSRGREEPRRSKVAEEGLGQDTGWSHGQHGDDRGERGFCVLQQQREGGDCVARSRKGAMWHSTEGQVRLR